MTILWIFIVAFVAWGKGRKIIPWAIFAITFHGWLLIPLMALPQKPIRFDAAKVARVKGWIENRKKVKKRAHLHLVK